MTHELLTPAQMAEVDRLAAAAGPFDGWSLMKNAGAAVAAEVLKRHPDAALVHVLAGPGNNGGDGYVVAANMRRSGVPVALWRLGAPRTGSDAALAAADWGGGAGELADFRPGPGAVVVDGLFGAGLSKPLEGAAAEAVRRCRETAARVVAIDLPSGLSGASGAALGPAFAAELTVTFFRKKPGHLLYPGRDLCGETIVVDIGIPESVLKTVRPACRENRPDSWMADFPRPGAEAHKYARGHVAVCSGPAAATGAARLAARGAARIGAGAVTVLSPAGAMLVNAAHLTAIMLRRANDADELAAFLADRRPSAAAIGPGFGVGDRCRAFALALLAANRDWPQHPLKGLVLDADAVTSFRDQPEALFAAAAAAGAPTLVLTPHEGEFLRLFPDLAADAALSKLDRARAAAVRAHAVVVYKGPDTVVAAPDGRAAINANGTPYLATAGLGDVLAGMIAGLLAQGMSAFEAASAAVWLHAEAGRRFGPGLIAEDLPELLPAVMGKALGCLTPQE